MIRVRARNPRVSGHKSNRVSQLADPRVGRTRALLAQALVALLSRRSYVRIRVSDIARRAGIGRATFYAHFASKDALLRSEIERVVLPMLVEVPGDPGMFDCTRFFAHVHSARAIYLSLMAAPARAVTEAIVRDVLEPHIARPLAARAAANAAHPQAGYLARFVAGTMLLLIGWSLEQTEPPPPAQLQAAFRRLVGPALSG